MAAMTVIVLLTLAPMITCAAAAPPKLTVDQVFTTSSPDADGAFTYLLTPLEPDSQTSGENGIERYTFTITGTDRAEIELPGCTRPGVFKYELSQVVSTEKQGYRYDRHVYIIEVYVYADADTQVIIFNEDGTKAAGITFLNAYDPIPSDPALMADTPVIKTVFGNPGYASTFTFKLEAQERSNPMPPGSADGLKTIYITGSGRNEFGAWSYDKPGTYYYTVFEVNTGEKGYRYDAAVYTITDMVRDDGGKLVLTRVVTNSSNRPVTSMIFNNYYNSGKGPTDPPGKPDPQKPGNPTNPGGVAPGPQNPPKPPRVPVGDIDSHLNPPDVPGSGFDYLDPPDVPGGGLDNNDPGVPKTGDEINTGLYSIMFLSGSAVTVAATVYLLIGGKRQRRRAEI